MTDIRSMYTPKYLESWMLPDKSGTKLVIDRVVQGELVTEGGGKEAKPLIYFKGKPPQGKDLPFVLSRRNRKAVISMYGTDSDQWPGKEILIFEDMRKCFGEMLPVLSVKGRSSRGDRMKERLPDPATHANGPDTRQPGEEG
jgi:hypothetical protein